MERRARRTLAVLWLAIALAGAFWVGVRVSSQARPAGERWPPSILTAIAEQPTPENEPVGTPIWWDGKPGMALGTPGAKVTLEPTPTRDCPHGILFWPYVIGGRG